MSHFTVLVVCDEDTTEKNVEERLEEALAPFNEDVSHDSQYAVFQDVTEKYRKEYEEEGVERIVMPDGRLLMSWDEEFRIKGEFGCASGTHKPPADLERRQVPYKETYRAFDEFITDWCGYEYNEFHKAYGYWRNPNAKWDWWQIGGRWQGLLTVKHGTVPDTLLFGESGVFGPRGNDYDRPEGRRGCDGCRKGDLDLEWGCENNIRSTRARWERMVAEGHQDDIGRRRFEYGFDETSSLEDELRKAQNCHPFQTFAMLKDGAWFERGEMGWWATVFNDKGCGEWCGEVQQLWDEIPDESVVVVVDCHI